jgi:hypothetical protein
MGEDITNECNDRADGCLPPDTVSRPVHLQKKYNGGQCAYGSTNRRKEKMLGAERCENVASRHDEKASEPRPTKLFNGRAD